MKTSYDMAQTALERRDICLKKRAAGRRRAALIATAAVLLALPALWRGRGAQPQVQQGERVLQFAYVSLSQTQAGDSRGEETEKYQSAAPPAEDASMDVCRPYYGRTVTMWPRLEQLWYGRQFWAVELAGLTLTENCGSYLYFDAQGESVLADSAYYCWANGSYFDGSPLAPCDGGQLLTLNASKSGILRCGLWPQSGQSFGWDDREITLRVYEYDMGYNYDENGEPQQSYRCLRAWFVMDGIEFEIVGEAVPKETFEACVRQVMWGA
ncbi:MAG: hypothetical protein IJP01_05015 [Oscillospiraceae bacterium]|nr:hypothetical protein [Oscillospiraceae bacterium]